MKYIISLLLITFLVTALNAQNVGIGTSNPAPSAMLDVKSATKGFLPPRMNTAERNAIASPAIGLTIYNTTISGLESFNGLAWTSSTNSSTAHFIGESYGGGIVFYVYDNGQHGLIAATADQSTAVRWYAGTFTNTMALADGVGAGKANTAIIIASQGFGDGGTYAARICNEYSVFVNGVTYGDWYLPSKYELNLMYMNIGQGAPPPNTNVGGFANNVYWSSTENNLNSAWDQNFNNDNQLVSSKSNPFYVRAVRVF